MTIVNFTPIPALIGGIFIAIAATLLLLFNGRIFGITGIMSGILTPKKGDLIWRAMMVIGLVLGAFIAHKVIGSQETVNTRSIGWLIAGGFITGLGARLGSGCTSGHGVCGISRMSKRSLVATCTFMATGAITVFIMRLLGV